MMSVANDSSSFDALARSNVNSAWGALTIEVLVRLGVETTVISPGSRSTPLAVAASRNAKMEAIAILDERSAGFFALGLAKRTHRPVVLVCTSGSAVVNYYPAVLEASMSGTPLLILTADRPAELRDCSAGQTIDQTKIFGVQVRFFHELSLPEKSPSMLAYLRQTLVHAVKLSLQNNPGPVHLNFPFRDPLSPDSGHSTIIDAGTMDAEATVITRICESANTESNLDQVAMERLLSHRRGLIIVGAANPCEGGESFAGNVLEMANKLGWPVLSDVLNPLRGYSNKYPALIAHYDILLRNNEFAANCMPSAILQIGMLPTSKVLRRWLARIDAVSFLLSDRPVNLDPLHRVAVTLAGTAEALNSLIQPQETDSKWIEIWKNPEQQVAATLDDQFEQTSELFEGKIAWILSRHLPKGTPAFIANSMSIRYGEHFWCMNQNTCPIYCNRGTNGIDGTLGTAIGMAHRSKPAILLTGDLAFLHDSNALSVARELKGSLTVVLANNQGGGIFEHLPVSRMPDSFEKYFATPQNVHIDTLCQAYGVSHNRIQDWNALIKAIKVLPESGVRVIEVPTDRKADFLQLQKFIDVKFD